MQSIRRLFKQPVWLILPYLLSLAALFSGCQSQEMVPEYPSAKEGVLDLRDWNFEQSGSLPLQGEYRFFWRRFLPASKSFNNDNLPSHRQMEVPGKWNGKLWQEHPLPGSGFATYQLTVLMPQDEYNLSLKLLDVATAFRLYLNGSLITQSGTPSSKSENNHPAFYPHVAVIPAVKDTMHMIIHVASFEHYKGGIWEHIIIGKSEDIRGIHSRSIIYQALLFGALIAIGLYNLFIGFYRRIEPATVFFGLLCLDFGLRIICVDQRLLMHFIPDFPWWLLNKAEYLTFSGGEAFYALFFYFLYPQDFPGKGLWAIVGISSLYSLIIILTSVKIFSSIVIYYQIVTGLVLLFGMFVIIRCIRNDRPQALLSGLAALPFFIAVVLDMFTMQGVIHYQQVAPLGLLCSALLNAYLLAIRHMRSFEAVKKHRAALEIANENYERVLKEQLLAEAENKRLQEKLSRSQKMEALGLLAGGVAHDLNNVLTGIVSYPDLLLLDMPKDHPMYKPLILIRSSGRKAAAIVQDLLALARRNITHLAATDLNRIIREYTVSPEYHLLLKYHPAVEVLVELDNNLPPIRGAEVHLRKALMNLVSNAAEAQPKGGKIFVSTESRYLETDWQGYEIVPTGQYIVLRVEDHGIGLNAEDIRRMFEPFYTKKVMGRSGTGLGMAVIWGTIRDHEGFIDVTSEIDSGTTIELYFCPTREKIITEQAELPIESYSGNGEQILVIDDLESQRVIATSILQRLGYQAITLESGEAAIDYLKSDKPDFIILDMIMDPGMDGLDTYKKIRELNQNITVIIASGYAETDRVRTALKLGAEAYLRKPYTVETLGTTIRKFILKNLPKSEQIH